jgi:2,5-furandicarboxylate decarboxylase 1
VPILCNVFADPARAAWSIGTTPARFAQRWLEAEPSPIPPVVVGDGPAHEVVRTGAEVDVLRIPAVRHFAGDAGRYLPSAVQVARDPDTGVRNLSYARMLLKGRDRLAVCLHSRAHLWDYQRRAEERGRPLEVAAVVGPHPAVCLAAGCKLGIEVDEYDVAGALLGRPVELVRGVTVDVEVPADAELVVEGRILPGAREDEGPFGEYTGCATSRSTRTWTSSTSARSGGRWRRASRPTATSSSSRASSATASIPLPSAACRPRWASTRRGARDGMPSPVRCPPRSRSTSGASSSNHHPDPRPLVVIM